MGKRKQFIGRSQELAEIGQLVDAFDTTKIIYINGPGGVGKTTLLQQVAQHHASHPELQIIGIVDFADPVLRSDRSVKDALRDRLGSEHFVEYAQKLDYYAYVIAGGSSPEQTSNVEQRGAAWAEQQADMAWVECYNKLAQQLRIVVLFDTAEAVQELDFFAPLLETFQQLKNTLFLFAGRRGDDLKQALDEQESAIELIVRSVAPFSDAEAEHYFETSEVGRSLDADLRAKILLLSSGLPVLLDLSLDWIERSIPLPELLEMRLDVLQALAQPKRLDDAAVADSVRALLKLALDVPIDELRRLAIQRWQQQIMPAFRRGLVRQVLHLAEPSNLVILDMAHVYRHFDVKTLAFLLDKPETHAKELLVELRDLASVKSLPEDSYALHDEMRDMVNEYAWSLIDTNGELRRQIDQRMVQYYGRRAGELQNQVDRIDRRLEQAEGSARERFELNLQLADRERNLLMAKLELLFHTLRIDHPAGIQRAHTYYDIRETKLRRPYEKELADLAVQVINDPEFSNAFNDDDRYSVDYLRLKYALDQRRLDEAREIYTRLDRQMTGKPDQQLDLQTRLARLAELSRRPQEALEHHEQALEICNQDETLARRWKGQILNSIGRMYRLMGKFDAAVKSYEAGLALISATADDARLAAAYNNLGFVIGLTSKYERALRYCKKALEIQQRLGLQHDSGRTLNTLSIIYRSREDFTTSLGYIEQALEIFTEFKNDEWAARALCERGVTYWYTSNLEKARADLQQSLEIEQDLRTSDADPPSPNLINALHALGHIAWEEEQFDDAEKYFEECARLAEQVSDIKQAVNSLEGLVEVFYARGYLAHQSGNIAERDQYYAKAEQMAEMWSTKYAADDFPLYAGSRLRILGDIAYDRGHYQDALEYYKPAYRLIAVRGGYSRYVFEHALEHLQKRMDDLHPQLAIQWCIELQQFWGDPADEKSLAYHFPEMLDVCRIVRQGAERRDSSGQ
jgi:tetratricopeptide (TPR) repeat protein